MANSLAYLFQLIFQNAVLVNASNVLMTSSVMSCAKLCAPPCVSFFYNKQYLLCHLSSDTYLSTDPNLKSDDGWMFYQSTKVSVPCYPGYMDLSSVGMCIKFVTNRKKYSDARADCESVPGGRIVHLDTSAKIAAVEVVHRKDYGNLRVYIGLNDEPSYRTGDFHWTDGTPLTDHNWNAGQPDNRYNDNCVMTGPPNNYKWVDLFCTDKLSYVCEIVL